MFAEYSANALQLIQPGSAAIFTNTPVKERRGLIFHRDETGIFRLASPAILGCRPRRSCCCVDLPFANYLVSFSGNISVPTGGTVGEIELAIGIGGVEDPSSTMVFTPAAVDVAGNVSTTIGVQVPWICRCESISVINTSDQAIQLENANLVIDYRGVN